MNNLIVITGPTAVGKTELALLVAETLGTEIVSADSRQIYKEMSIGTAVPNAEQLARVRHHLVQSQSVCEPINAYDYEQMALERIADVGTRCGGNVVLTGGSMMYVDAVCNGIDEMPTINENLRDEIKQTLVEKGLEHMTEWLKRLDPECHSQIDLKNPRRVLHAIEICLQSGKTCSELRIGKRKERPFKVTKIALSRPREELYARINARVIKMMDDGLLDEVTRLMPMRDKTPLLTVGYRELFAHLDGEISKEEAVRQIQRNTRHYAKKQETWLRSDKEYTYVDAKSEQALDEALRIIGA